MTLFDADELAEPPIGPTVRVRLVVAYDGSGFRGFAVNDGVHTVGGALAEAISTVLGHPIELTVAGRTDRGVHARGQVVTFDARADLVDLPALQRSLNKMLAPDIAVRDPPWSPTRSTPASRPPPGATGTSCSTRRPRPVPRPHRLARRQAAVAPQHGAGVDPFVGEHDFAAFCRRPKTSDGSAAPWFGGSRTPIGTTTARAASGSRSRRTPSATRWSARSSGR